MKLKLFFICVLAFVASCNKSQEPELDVLCSCPHSVIYIQPLGSFTKQKAESIIPSLEKNFGKWLYGEWVFKVLDQKALPKEAYVKERDRYKAVKILDRLKKNPRKEGHMSVVYIGLTHEDICTDIHGKKNYGIIGLSYSPGYVCVISDYRVNPKSMLWKPVMHEFNHAFFGAKHCPNNNPRCFMKDANGKGDLKVQDRLCSYCSMF